MNILLIRLRLIGDVVFTTPIIGALKRRFPDATLTYLVEPAAEPVVRHHPDLDRVIVAPRPRGLERLAFDLRLGRELRAMKFDVAIDLHGGTRANFFTFMTGAPRRIGYALPGRFWCYTERLPWTRSLVPPRHSVLNQWDLIAPLGVGAADRARDPVVMTADPEAVSRVHARLAAARVPETARLVVIHVSAGNPFRRWPASSFAKVAAALVTDPRRRIIITSGPSEADAAEAVAAEARTLAGDGADRVLRCGEFDLAELKALVDRAALYIGGDSGPLHIAATSRVPIVGLYGPTLPVRSAPWRDRSLVTESVEVTGLPCRPCDQRVCAPGDFRCLTRISADMVFEASDRALARANRT